MEKTAEERLKKKLIQKVNIIAKKIWGQTKIGDVPAYIFWTRLWAKIVYGVERRRELNLQQWHELYLWIRKIQKEVEKGNEAQNEGVRRK